MKKGKKQELQKVQPESNDIIHLTESTILDLTSLTEAQKMQLKEDHAKGMIDMKKKAAELKIDVGALDAALNSIVTQTSKAGEAGAHATISHTQTTKLGRTEVVIGNTDKAAKGKLSRSATGEENKTLMIIAIIAVVAIILAIIIFGGK